MKCLILQLEIINMKIYIKHMVSNRCKMVVREELKKLGLHFIFVEFGEIEVMENITGEKSDLLKIELQQSGLDLLDDNKTILIEGIKNTLSELIYTSDYLIKINYNKYLSTKFNLDIKYISDLFVAAQGITLDQFIMSHKIERIKEMIIYDGLDILEISQKLNFSDVANLYYQFKLATGFSPYNFKQLKIKRHSVIEEVLKKDQ